MIGLGLNFWRGGSGVIPLITPGFVHPAFAFTRASAKTLIGAGGALASVGNNIPAFDSRGLGIHGARTNLLLNNAALSTQNVTVTAAAHTLSFRGTGSVTLSGAATGTLAGTGANLPVALTFTPTAGTLTITVTGSVLEAQLELGVFASPSITTAGATATRLRDDMNASLSSLLLPATGAAFFGVFTLFDVPTTAPHRVLIQPDGGTDTNRFLIRLNTSDARIFIYQITGGSSAAATTGAVSPGVPFALGFSMDSAGRAALTLNGAAPAVVLAGPTLLLNTLRIGSNAAGIEPMFGFVSRLYALPYPVSDAELQARTLAA